MDQKTINCIKDFELEMQKQEVRRSPERMSEILADDFFEFTRNGKKYSKKEIIDVLLDLPEENFLMSDFNLVDVSENSALVTYVVDREIVETKVKSRTLCSSIWKETGGKWQQIFFQGTTAQ